MSDRTYTPEQERDMYIKLCHVEKELTVSQVCIANTNSKCIYTNISVTSLYCLLYNGCI